MQRVVSINLNGNAYQVEEHGYNALFAFLDATESALTDDPDRAQKLADLERLIADKCQAYLGPHKTVITSSEVDRLLTEIEPARAQPAAQAAPASSSSSSSGPSSNSTSNSSSTSSSSSSGAGASQSSSSWHAGHKRLYQIREGAMISGVCMGLSEFLHIDVTVIRILFVIFALASSGWGMLAYAVLMFVVPKVETRAAASGVATGTMPPYHWPWDTHGWPWDTHGWPWDTHGWPWDPPKAQSPAQGPTPGAAPSQTAQSQTPPPQAAPATRQEWRDQRREWRAEARAARMAQPGHHIFGTMSLIVFLMIGFFWLSFWSRGNFFFGWPFFWGFPHWIGIVFFFMMLRFIFMPFRGSRWHGYGPYAPHPHYAWVSMWNGLMWFAGIIFLVWAVYHFVPDVHDRFRDIQSGSTYRYHV